MHFMCNVQETSAPDSSYGWICIVPTCVHFSLMIHEVSIKPSFDNLCFHGRFRPVSPKVFFQLQTLDSHWDWSFQYIKLLTAMKFSFFYVDNVLGTSIGAVWVFTGSRSLRVIPRLCDHLLQPHHLTVAHKRVGIKAPAINEQLLKSAKTFIHSGAKYINQSK